MYERGEQAMKSIIESIRNKIRYKSEFILSRNPAIQIAILAIVALILTAITTIVLTLTRITPESWQEYSISKVAWSNLMHVIDQGTMVSDTGSWQFLLVMLVTTVFGLIIVSMLIGIISEGFETKVEELKKGRSAVVEKNHFVILGWSAKIFHVINQLIIGHELSASGPGKPCIVILADKKKVEMEDAIYDNCENSKKARIICRSGNPIILEKLRKLSIAKADTILILASDKKNPDTFVFKIGLAIIELCKSYIGKHKMNRKTIIAEIYGKDNATLLQEQIDKCKEDNVKNNKSKTKLEVQFLSLDSKQIISEIIAQTSIQRRLSEVYSELLKFSKNDNEIYFEKVAKFPAIESGTTFKDLLFMFEQSCLIGYLQKGDDEEKNELIINPLCRDKEPLKPLSPDDELIFIAKQRKDIKFNEKLSNIAEVAQPKVKKQKLSTSNTVIFGYNQKIFSVIEELNNYVQKESKIAVVADENVVTEKEITDYFKEYPVDKLTIEFTPIKSKVINEEVIVSLGFERIDNIIILNYGDVDENGAHDEVGKLEEVDAYTIKSLLNIRKYFDKKENKDKRSDAYSIVTEMKFAHNKEIIPKGPEDDFIISDEIISSIIAQTVLNKNLGKLYYDILLKSEGCEIYLKDAAYYVPDGENTCFNEIIKSAANLKEIAIGYISHDKTSNDKNPKEIITLNPPKDIELKITDLDKVITIAKDYAIS